jgi:hypothetical protein
LFLHPEIVQSTNTVDSNGLNRSAVPQNPDLRSASTRKQDQKDDIMRNMLVAALVLGMALAVSATSSAATLDQDNSFLDVKLGSVPQIHLSAQSTNVVLTGNPGTHAIAEAASVFQTNAFTVASAAFTGLPSLTALKLSLVGGAGSFGEAASYANPMNGAAVVSGFGVSKRTPVPRRLRLVASSSPLTSAFSVTELAAPLWLTTFSRTALLSRALRSIPET